MVDSATVGLIYSAVIGIVVFLIFWVLFELLKNSRPHIFEFRKWIQDYEENFKEFRNENGEFVGYLPNQPPRGWLTWLTVPMTVSDDEIQRYLGYDVCLYVISLRNKVFYFSVMGAIACIILIPVYATAGDKAAGGVALLSMSNLETGSARFWATFIVDFVLVYLSVIYIMIECRTYVKRREQFRAENIAANYAVSVMDLRKDRNTEELVRQDFEMALPGEVEGVQLTYGSAYLRKKFNLYRTAQNKKEVAQYQIDNGKDGKRPRHHTVPCTCCCTGTVDSQEYWSEQQTTHAEEIETAQEKMDPKVVKPCDSAIVVFKTKKSAAVAAQTKLFGMPLDSYTIDRQEAFKSVHWHGMRLSYLAGLGFSINLWVWLVVVLVFWAPISAAIMGLANLESLAGIPAFSWLVDILSASEAVKGLIEGFLPPLVTIVLALLPAMLMMIFAGLERHPSLEKVHNKQRTMRYIFLFFAQFLYIVLAGTALSYLDVLINDPTEIVPLLAQAIPEQATFFLNFVLTACFIGNALALSQVVRMIVIPLFKKFFKTPRQRKGAQTFGAEFSYVVFYTSTGLLSTITIIYSSIAPLINLFAVIYFVLTYAVHKYNLLYTHYCNYEHGGSMFWGNLQWNFVALYLKTLTMCGIMGLNEAIGPAIVSAINLIPLLVVHVFVNKRYGTVAWYGSLEYGSGKPAQEEVNPNYLPQYKTPELWAISDVPQLKEPMEDLEENFYDAEERLKDDLESQGTGESESKVVEEQTAGGEEEAVALSEEVGANVEQTTSA
uniref:CSC1/OSCA1-like 7TM region domain-containing protein n=1 Tax=Rhodosorus marinus TaxID=101924 RepID=A0A7S3EJK6_9RHOD|mmetsp:Transcript_4156/g.17492  ORF Transcript_4156/g.17492 Transcript_4156/m.17492 type:complete len:776 (+) Transcript_4156:148-2475(+)|eukprot:CAMPEP_0113961706 /NCGR_PEP_ID=MMETSP0011_2-20120614/5478_1 /TAXON_ID=101924 /ORGANISM="Rhodosorus marinus" /LENGTH=775 /DNA_ID=CAMNT_0000973417 /DNA_START=116 /DNA_END=2443 /DNA_ORIENTATION=+ /assembly_acc=CAM_ASM_000156